MEIGLDAVPNGHRGVDMDGERQSDGWGDKVEDGRSTAGGEGGGEEKVKHGRQGLRSSAVRVMLDGYWEILKKVVILALVLRLGVGAAVGLAVWRRLVRARRRI